MNKPLTPAERQAAAIANRLRSNKVKNRYAARGKVKQIRQKIAHDNWLGQ